MMIVLWGHLLHSHSQSYTYEGFRRAGESMGYEVIWLDDVATDEGIRPGAIFITEGQVDKNIPMRDDCFYVLHNCKTNRYLSAGVPAKNILSLEVSWVLGQPQLLAQAQWTNSYSFVIPKGKDGTDILYQPWATNLLPEEIIPDDVIWPPRGEKIVFIGSYNDGGSRPEFGNKKRLDAFALEAHKDGTELLVGGMYATKPQLGSLHDNPRIETSEATGLVKGAFMAPAIQGGWQTEYGCLTCRIFKNISYGQMGITNSPKVKEVFGELVVFNENCAELYWDAKRALEDGKDMMMRAMDDVRNKHTYVQRLEAILEMLGN